MFKLLCSLLLIALISAQDVNVNVEVEFPEGEFGEFETEIEIPTIPEIELPNIPEEEIEITIPETPEVEITIPETPEVEVTVPEPFPRGPCSTFFLKN